MIHTPSDTAYAIAPLQRTFFEAAMRVEGDQSRIHFSYPELFSTQPLGLPDDFKNLVEARINLKSREEGAKLEAYVRNNRIQRVLAFDMGIQSGSLEYLRRGGVKWVASYWGAPMSSLNSGLKLLAKRVEVGLRRNKPDHFVFESEGMRETAVSGRGVPSKLTSVIRLGVDLDRFKPLNGSPPPLPEELHIPPDRFLVFYSGHFEPRKGVSVIIEAARYLVEELGEERFHFLLCGNIADEADPYLSTIRGTPTADHVTFAGYRSDLTQLMWNAQVGLVASTGWDSFPRSAIEMSACGLPLVVSDLQGLRETVIEGETGFTFPRGDSRALGQRLLALANQEGLRARFALAGRARAEKEFSISRQVNRLTKVLSGDVPLSRETEGRRS
jgi:glycosyltransferase involved in cell wall biosynthesis